MKRKTLFGLLIDENGKPLTTAATMTAGDPNETDTSNDLGDTDSSPGGDGGVGF